ncbi:MAG TPA: hypothetical protein PLT75_11170 [Spirochaetota bacterium]|nr:hypothetical protein [Spirochaetota bacterium]
MKRNIIMLSAVVSVIFMITCAKEGHDHGDVQRSEVGNTKIVTTGGIQAAFDLMDRAHHEGMMKKMNTPVETEAEFSDYLLLTLMKKPENTLIKDAVVSFSIKGPGNSVVTKKGHIMTGMGMHHYAAGFNMKAKGSYTVTAEINLSGKVVTVDTVFEKK